MIATPQLETLPTGSTIYFSPPGVTNPIPLTIQSAGPTTLVTTDPNGHTVSWLLSGLSQINELSTN